MITWPHHGLSGHPDHVAVSRWTRLAFQAARALGSETPLALYHMVVPQSIADTLGFSRLHATPDEKVSLTVDVTAAWEQKLDAIRCHRTQAGESPILDAPHDRQRLFLGTEHFQQAADRDERDVLQRYLAEANLHAKGDHEA
jgi:LmbE family N-acetylglucosaminyl deacetylase